MPFASIRLIVADLDGTLVGTDGRVWNDLRDLIRSVAHPRYGVRFTVATGRTLQGAQRMLDLLGLSGVPVVLYNGGVVADASKQRLLMKVTLGSDRLEDVLTIAAQWPVNVLAYYWVTEEDSFFVPTLGIGHGEIVLGWSNSGLQPEVEFNGQPVMWQDAWHAPPEAEPCAVLVDVPHGMDDLKRVCRELATISGVAVTRSGSRFAEIRPSNCTKWTGVRWVTERLSILDEEVLALGDSENDIEMLASAGVGVAVRNAPPDVLGVVHYVAARDSAGGALEVLRIVKEARRLRPGLRPFRPLAQLDRGK